MDGWYEEDHSLKSVADYVEKIHFSYLDHLLDFLSADRFHRGEWIFRGHTDSSWPLQSTLHRFVRGVG
jgi:hypothetical protein